MNAKENAKELVGKYFQFVDCGENIYYPKLQMYNAKQCSLIAVDEIINELQQYSDLESIIVFNEAYSSVIERLTYWQEVKQEIEKL